MTNSPTPPSPLDHRPPDGTPPQRRLSPLQYMARFVGGMIGGFAIVFIPTFFAGGAAFGDAPVPWWAWPSVIVAALPCAAYAWFARRRNPATSSGIWFGTGVGLLLAGICFATN